MFSFMKEKLSFECLCQVVGLSLGKVHAGNDDFSAGKRSVIGKRLSD